MNDLESVQDIMDAAELKRLTQRHKYLCNRHDELKAQQVNLKIYNVTKYSKTFSSHETKCHKFKLDVMRASEEARRKNISKPSSRPSLEVSQAFAVEAPPDHAQMSTVAAGDVPLRLITSGTGGDLLETINAVDRDTSHMREEVDRLLRHASASSDQLHLLNGLNTAPNATTVAEEIGDRVVERLQALHLSQFALGAGAQDTSSVVATAEEIANKVVEGLQQDLASVGNDAGTAVTEEDIVNRVLERLEHLASLGLAQGTAGSAPDSGVEHILSRVLEQFEQSLARYEHVLNQADSTSSRPIVVNGDAVAHARSVIRSPEWLVHYPVHGPRHPNTSVDSFGTMESSVYWSLQEEHDES